jgi:hypothetical protein
MASLRKKGRTWFFRVVDADGVQREHKGCSDRRATEGMAAAVEAEAARVRSGLTDPKDLAYCKHEARPLVDHLQDFQAALLAKGGTRKHARVTTHRAERVLDLAKAKRISELSLFNADFRGGKSTDISRVSGRRCRDHR